MKAQPCVWHNQAIPYEADFSLNGNLSELERLAAEISRFCRENSLDEDAEFQLNLVLEELFVNTVRHGGCEGVDDSTRVRLLAAADGVEVEFADRGRPFDPTAARARECGRLPWKSARPAGWESIWSAQIMRDLHYERAGEWNQISMKRPQSVLRRSYDSTDGRNQRRDGASSACADAWTPKPPTKLESALRAAIGSTQRSPPISRRSTTFPAPDCAP